MAIQLLRLAGVRSGPGHFDSYGPNLVCLNQLTLMEAAVLPASTVEHFLRVAEHDNPGNPGEHTM